MTSHGTLLRDGANYRPAAVGARNAAAGDEAGVQGPGSRESGSRQQQQSRLRLRRDVTRSMRCRYDSHRRRSLRRPPSRGASYLPFLPFLPPSDPPTRSLARSYRTHQRII